MDRRTVIALLLVAAVVLITPRIFPTRRATPSGGGGDSAVTLNQSLSPSTARDSTRSIKSELPDSGSARSVVPNSPHLERESPPVLTMISGSLAQFQFTSDGAVLNEVGLKTHRALGSEDGNAALRDPTGALLGFRLLVDRDTISLKDARFRVSTTSDENRLDYEATVQGTPVRISYTVVPDSYLVRVAGGVGLAESAGRRASFLLVDLPRTLRSFEADTLADQATLSYAVKPAQRSAEAVPFRDLDPGERRLIAGPISWAVAKNKYFMFGVLFVDGDESTAEVQMVGGARESKVPTMASATLVKQLGPDGSFSFDLYTGPQEYRRLQAMGRDFENSNPYGGWMQAFVQPFATIVMRILLWMKAALPISYGWLLVLFGIAVRLILWPLNQGAMRTSMRMQRIQPELNAIQTKYKSDPQRLQTEMMRIYKEHNMSPFSAFAGCLPLLLPMPILFALFFVFQNTIEFRGVPFLWLADISLKDPYYIVPLFMGVSMFVMSWVGLRNAPPNPQAKMMAYVLPVVMTVMFANFASGLNLYYAIQNVAAIPQQWLIANERSKTAVKRA